MEQIKILFFVIGSFFGMEDGRIAADKTTVIISPEIRQIEIIQDHLFTVIQTETDSALAIEQWKQLIHWEEPKFPWVKELDSLETKKVTFQKVGHNFQPRIVLKYSNEKQLRALGIWYNAEKKQFSVNHIPQQNLTTDTGTIEGNYWVFDDDVTFSFILEPFLEIPEQFQQFKVPLVELLKDKK